MKMTRRTLRSALWTVLVGVALLSLVWTCHQVGPVAVRAQSGACPQGPVDQAGGAWHTYYCTQFNSLSASEDVPPVAGNNGSWLTGAPCGGAWQIAIEYDAVAGSDVLKMTAENSRCYGYAWRDDDETGSGGSHPQGGTFPLRTGGRDGVRVRMRLRPIQPAPPSTFCNTAGYGVNGTTYYWPGSNPNLVFSMLGFYGQAGSGGPSHWYREMSGGHSGTQNFSCNSLPGYMDLLLTGLEAPGGGAPTWAYQLSSDGGATWQTVWTHTGEIGWPLGASFGDPTLQPWPGLWPPLYVDFFSTEYWTQATPTPPPTATPYVQAYTRNPQGQAVNVAGMGRSRFDVGGPGYASFYPDRSSYTGAALDYAGRVDRGAFFRSYGDQVLMGVTPSPNGVAWQSGTTNLYYGWANWYTGGRSVVAVYATATPTPNPGIPWIDDALASLKAALVKVLQDLLKGIGIVLWAVLKLCGAVGLLSDNFSVLFGSVITEAIDAVIGGSIRDVIRGSLMVSIGFFGLSLLARPFWPDLKIVNFQRTVVWGIAIQAYLLNAPGLYTNLEAMRVDLADEGRKAEPGKRTEEYKTATVKLPLVTAEDLEDRTQGKTPPNKRMQKTHDRDRKRVARLVKAAAEQGGLLTVAELSVILNKPYELVRKYAREWEEETGELLPLKGYRMDQGSRPTHKREIARLHEEGLEPPDIARASGHSVKSVERYLQDYERVRMLLKRGMSVEDISATIGRGKRVVVEYVELAREYHPELFEGEK